MLAGCYILLNIQAIFTRASVGKPESENATVFLTKRRVMVPGVPCVDHGNWGRERDIARL